MPDEAEKKLLRAINRAPRARSTEPTPPPAPRGHGSPAGTQKVTMNLRTELYEALRARAREGGVAPVTVIEALVERYLSDEALRDEVDDEAALIARARRRLARAQE